MAAKIKQELDLNPELIKGFGGVFTVQVDDEVIAQKTQEFGFPTEEAIVDAIRSHGG